MIPTRAGGSQEKGGASGFVESSESGSPLSYLSLIESIAPLLHFLQSLMALRANLNNEKSHSGAALNLRLET